MIILRVMALDIGSKNIGVAISDPLGMIAYGLEVIERTAEDNIYLQKIKELVEHYQVEEIVVGFPRHMKGTPGTIAADVLAVVERLRGELRIPIVTWDERLTTVAAEKILIAADMRREKRKKKVDKVAAALILESYLNRRRSKMQEALDKDSGNSLE